MVCTDRSITMTLTSELTSFAERETLYNALALPLPPRSILTAIVMTVQCWKVERMMSCTALSVALSTDAVASSKTTIRHFLTIARAMQNNWNIQKHDFFLSHYLLSLLLYLFVAYFYLAILPVCPSLNIALQLTILLPALSPCFIL